MISLYIISLSVFVLYNIYVITQTKRIPVSISDTYYDLKIVDARMLFAVFCWAVSLPLLIFWIDLKDNDWNLLPFLACVGLSFVGASPAFRDYKLEQKVHRAAAVICAAAAYVWAFLWGDIPTAASFVFITTYIVLWNVIFKENIKTSLYWVEVFAFVNIYVQLIL